jgi:hypothetical protein
VGKVSDEEQSFTTISSITLESSIKVLVAPFTLIYDVYSVGITYDKRNIFIVEATRLVVASIFRLPEIYSRLQ